MTQSRQRLFPLLLEVQNEARLPAPDREHLRDWVEACLDERQQETEICIRIVDDREMTDLNHRYRNHPETTNVLSFPANLPAAHELPLLGDLVLCAPLIRRQAGEWGRKEEAHWAHMVVHGTLHLLGYDHQQPDLALHMERRENAIVQSCGFPPPYPEHAPGD